MTVNKPAEKILLRPPEPRDGAALHRLIGNCPPLDENSVYCNLLQCTHFAETSVLAESGAGLLGAISAYLIPGREDTLFVWQVAVDKSARGQAIGRRMLNHILARTQCAGVRYLETTVTRDNAASWAMFEGFARQSSAALQRSVLFESSVHFEGEHETELLARIGPLPAFPRREELRAITDYPTEKSA